MDRGSLRALAKAAGAGDLNLTDAQINSLIDNAIRDISTYLPTNRVPRLVERAGMGEAINENPNFDESDGTTVGGYELVNGSTVSTAAAGLLTGNTYSVLVDQSSGGLKTVMFPLTSDRITQPRAPGQRSPTGPSPRWPGRFTQGSCLSSPGPRTTSASTSGPCESLPQV